MGSSELTADRSGDRGKKTVIVWQFEQVLRSTFGADGMNRTGYIPITIAHFDIDVTTAVISGQQYRWFLAVTFPPGWFFPGKRQVRGSLPYWGGHHFLPSMRINRTHVLFMNCSRVLSHVSMRWTTWFWIIEAQWKTTTHRREHRIRGPALAYPAELIAP